MNDLTIAEDPMDENSISILQKSYANLLSNTFKLWVVTIIFLVILLHLYAINMYPQNKILSTEIILGIVLLMVGYLWFQEIRDRDKLVKLNLVLIDAQKRLQKAEIETISTLVLTEEAKDPYVRGHSKMVARYSLAIAQELKLSRKEQRIIERAAILHDIGKLGISDQILKKPDKLSDEEWVIMKKHPLRSVEILRPLGFLVKEKEIILCHHERYDGKGYPGGFKGERIPIGARIMAVADTFDAMNSERSYRKPLSKEAILAELKRVSGTQLDTPVVNAFLNLLERSPEFWNRTEEK